MKKIIIFLEMWVIYNIKFNIKSNKSLKNFCIYKNNYFIPIKTLFNLININ